MVDSRADTLAAQGWSGHNVLDIPKWSAKENVKWLDSAIRRGDEFYLATDPAKHAAILNSHSSRWRASIPRDDLKTRTRLGEQGSLLVLRRSYHQFAHHEIFSRGRQPGNGQRYRGDIVAAGTELLAHALAFCGN